MAAPESTWSEELDINYVEGDFYGKWRLSSLFLAMQEAAARHAVSLDLGYYQLQLQPQRLAWMLSRFKACFERIPTAGERVIIQTWPKGIQRNLFFLRDFLILSAKDEQVLARASSAWYLVDITTRRLQRSSALPLRLPFNEGRHALDDPLDKLALPDALSEQFRLTARPSMLDLLGHVTSSRYLDWTADCFPVEAFQDGALGWLQINFTNEVRPGDEVAVSRGQGAAEGEWYVQGKDLNTGLTAFEAVLGFRGASNFA